VDKFIFAQSLEEAIQSRAQLSLSEIEPLLAETKRRDFVKGENFIQQGNSALSVGFVNKGLFKAFGTSSTGVEYIRNFCSQGYFIGAYAAAIQSAPADMTIEALEDSSVTEIDYKMLHQFFESGLNWQKLARTIAEFHYIEREQKEFRLLTLSALERYQLFQAENKHLLSRVSQADIASYIGVTPESLSRLLKQVNRDSKISKISKR